jgi:sulfonate transport system permease protein
MSVRSVLAEQVARPAQLDADLAIERRRQRRRRQLMVQGLRVLAAAVWLGSWELTARLNVVDPFFFGMPSGVARRMYTWITEGTALGPLWQQVAVTMEETVLGFIVGTALGIVAGVLLGRSRMLSDVFAPFIKAAN